MECDFDDCFFFGSLFAFCLREGCVDCGGIVIRKDASVSKLIGERFGSTDIVIKVLEFGADSFKAEINASFAFCLCLWRFDQWLDRIVLRDGVRYWFRWRVRVVAPVEVQVVTECSELLMSPVHWWW